MTKHGLEVLAPHKQRVVDVARAVGGEREARKVWCMLRGVRPQDMVLHLGGLPALRALVRRVCEYATVAGMEDVSDV